MTVPAPPAPPAPLALAIITPPRANSTACTASLHCTLRGGRCCVVLRPSAPCCVVLRRAASCCVVLRPTASNCFCRATARCSSAPQSRRHHGHDHGHVLLVCSMQGQWVNGPFSGNMGLRLNPRGPSPAAHSFLLQLAPHCDDSSPSSSSLHEPVVVLVVLHPVLAHLQHRQSEACNLLVSCCTAALLHCCIAAPSRTFSSNMHPRKSSPQRSLNRRPTACILPSYLPPRCLSLSPVAI